MLGTKGITSDPTQTHKESLAIAARQFGPLLEDLTELMQVQIHGLEETLEKAKAPYTPGRIPVWEGQ